jgi:hypothetical protein
VDILGPPVYLMMDDTHPPRERLPSNEIIRGGAPILEAVALMHAEVRRPVVIFPWTSHLISSPEPCRTLAADGESAEELSRRYIEVFGGRPVEKKWEPMRSDAAVTEPRPDAHVDEPALEAVLPPILGLTKLLPSDRIRHHRPLTW